MSCGHHCLPTKTSRHAALLEQSLRRGHHSLIPPFHNAILLWRVRRGEVTLDYLHGEVLGELGAGELSTIVGPQHLEFVASLLSLSLDLLHRLRRLVLGREQHHEHEARGINHEEEVAPAFWSRRRDWPAQVAVDELQRLLGAVRGLLRKRPAAYLGGDAGVADLRRVLNHRSASGHRLLAEPV